MAVRQSDALIGELVNGRSFYDRVAITTQVAISEVIRQKDDDVGHFMCRQRSFIFIADLAAKQYT